MGCWSPVGTLEPKFQEFMENAEGGAILISFGSTVLPSSMSPHFLSMFFAMMRKFSSVKFMWRWEGAPPENMPKNLMAANWLPQKEILAHPKTRALMSHCGLNSIIEATCFGVPVIGVPLFGDQDFNAYRLEAQAIGVKLELKGMTQENMDTAVEKILTNPEYKANMVIRSRILIDQPLNPVDSAVYWTEFALRNNNTSSFKLMGLDQPFYVRHMIDVYLAILFALIVLPIAITYALFVFVRTVVLRY
jgi:glucuronosyltransferase